jgi:hypothetical protein
VAAVERDPDPETFNLDRERDAIVALAIASRPNEEELREELQATDWGPVMSVPEALDVLAELTEIGERRTPRVVALQLLAKIAKNRGMERLDEAGDQLRHYFTVSVLVAREKHARREALARHRGDDEGPPQRPIKADQ